MSKKMLIAAAGAATVLVPIIFVVIQRNTNVNRPIAQLVAEKGTPTMLAKWLEVDKSDLRVLRVLVLPQDPQTVTNWNSITNAVLVWADSEPGRRNVRYFYDEMKSDMLFDGKGWYSSRSLFGDEKVRIAKTDADGNASGQKTFRVDAFAFQLMGFSQRKPCVDEQK